MPGRGISQAIEWLGINQRYIYYWCLSVYKKQETVQIALTKRLWQSTRIFQTFQKKSYYLMCSSCRAVIAALCWLGRLGQGRQHVSAGRAQWVWPRRSPAWRTSITRRGPGGLTTPAGLMLRGNLTGQSSNLCWGPAHSQANSFQSYILSYNKTLTFNQTKTWLRTRAADWLSACLQSPAGPGVLPGGGRGLVCDAHSEDERHPAGAGALHRPVHHRRREHAGERGREDLEQRGGGL